MADMVMVVQGENLAALEIEVGTIGRVTVVQEENLAALEIEVGTIGRVTVVQEENLAAFEIEENLAGLEIEAGREAAEQLVVFVQDKVSELEVFGVAVVERVGGFLLS
jgi:hypothetical protein